MNLGNNLFQLKKKAGLSQENDKEIQQVINNTNEKDIDKINWTNAWSKKYPILAIYQKEVNTKKYAMQIRELLEELKVVYKYSELDAMLVLKDILYHEWKDKCKTKKQENK